MGRHRRKVIDEKEEFDWPFKVCIDIRRTKPKICFMSGCPREFYPEDPGISKFGTTYCLPDDDSPKCNFVPSSNLLQKPISTFGYGIGGLSSRRFPKLLGLQTPGPNEYQAELTPPAPKKNVAKEKRTTWREFVEKYEAIVREQCERYDEERKASVEEVKKKEARKSIAQKQSTNVRKSPAHIPTVRRTPSRERDSSKKVKCQKRAAAFGMCLERPRFEKNLTTSGSTGGVGTYSIDVPVNQKKSFQITSPEGDLIPRVRTVCNASYFDGCMTCGRELVEEDYYQTKHKLKVLNEEQHVDGRYKMMHLALCRSCYCNALTYGVEPWHKTKVPHVFVKARHCNSIHDHKDGLKEFVTKSTCKGILHLARKELLYSRYFKDNPCDKAI